MSKSLTVVTVWTSELGGCTDCDGLVQAHIIVGFYLCLYIHHDHVISWWLMMSH